MNSIILGYPFLLLFALYAKKQQILKFTYILYFVGLIFFIGFRHDSPSGDYMAYYYRFLETKHTSTSIYNLFDNNGTGLAFIIFSIFFTDYQHIIFIYALIPLVLFSIWIWKYTERPFFALFIVLSLFYYQFCIEQYRQFAALGILTLAIFQDEKIKKLLIILLAACFHPTALIMLVLFLIPKKLYHIYIYISITVCVFAFDFILGNTLKSLFGDVLYVSKRISFYENYAEAKDIVYGFITTALIIRLFFFFYCYLYGKKYINPQILNIYFVSILFYKIFSFVPELASRGSVYFTLVEPIMVCMFFTRNHIKDNKKMFFFIIIFLLSIYRQMRFWPDFHDFTYQLNIF